MNARGRVVRGRFRDAFPADPPDWLPGPAAAVWRRELPALLAADIVRVTDAATFTVACCTWARAEAALAAGEVPARLLAEARRLFDAFLMTPAARRRAGLTGGPKA